MLRKSPARSTSTILIVILAAFVAVQFATGARRAAAQVTTAAGFATEVPLTGDEKLDIIRFMQSRLVQPEQNGRYFVRDARVLLPSSEESVGVFAYLVTLQTEVPDNRAYDLSDLYSIGGYYLVFVERSGDMLVVLDELDLTPDTLAERLNVFSTPPPEIIPDEDGLDFSDAVFDATDPALVEWRNELLDNRVPRWEWEDLTGDGMLECVLDIEGFEFQPTSYYSVLVTGIDGFVEAFNAWGYNTDYSEVEINGRKVVRADYYAISATGDYLPKWRDFFAWNGIRFVVANLSFAGEYTDLIPALEELALAAEIEESAEDSGWEGLTRYEINLTRWTDGIETPSEFYFNLARIAEYQLDYGQAENWWQTLKDYLDAEYDSEESVDVGEFPVAVRDSIPGYEEWRDELYAAAEAALQSDDFS
jgi:hypothetical protein